MSSPDITFYTNRGCPYCHRVYITLKELGLPFKEVLVDLTKPREDWYLKINPSGAIPALKYSSDDVSEVVLTESTVIAQFLCDTKPSQLLAASPASALMRARASLFIETWASKLKSFWIEIQLMDKEKKEDAATAAIERVQKYIEPLLANADPFFDGSKEFTIVEAVLAPFVMRLCALMDGGFLPASLRKGLDALPYFTPWAAAIKSRESVLYVWNKEEVIERSQIHIKKLKAAALVKAQA